MTFPCDRHWIEVGGKHGYIDRTGTVVIEPIFDYSMGFSEGLAETRDGERWGFIDPEGRWVIPPQYEGAVGFRNGRATVRVDGLWGCIDWSGTMVIRSCSETPILFSEGLAAVCRDLLYGYIDTGGQEVIPRQFRTKRKPKGIEHRAGRFSEGFAAVIDDASGFYGMIDRRGDFVISPCYTEAGVLSSGLMIVRDGSGLCRYVDVEGRDACGGRRFRESFGFSEGLAPADSSEEDEGWGYIDTAGRWVVPPMFEWGLSFSEGLAPVMTEPDGGFGYVDRFGRFVIPVEKEWSMACEFSGGLASVSVGQKQEQRWGYIDRAGRWVWEPTR